MFISTNIQEERPEVFGMRTSGGFEVISNSKDFKLVALWAKSFVWGVEKNVLFCSFFVKEDNGWNKGVDSLSFNSERDFIRMLSQTEEFSKAFYDLSNNK